jgi:hypothetical protein
VGSADTARFFPNRPKAPCGALGSTYGMRLGGSVLLAAHATAAVSIAAVVVPAFVAAGGLATNQPALGH